MVASDLRGALRVQHLPQGRFALNASKPGYADAQLRPAEGVRGRQADRTGCWPDYGERRDWPPPRGRDSGTGTTILGEPAARIYVLGLRVRYLNGRRDVVPAGSLTQTDDLGEYRISSLPPVTTMSAPSRRGRRARSGQRSMRRDYSRARCTTRARRTSVKANW